MTHINEYLLKTAGQKPQARAAQKIFEAGDFVACVDKEALDARFAIETDRVFQVRSYQDGGIALFYMHPGVYFDANRFRLVEGQTAAAEPYRAIPTRDPDFKGIAA